MPPPSYHRTVASALHLDALTLVRGLQVLERCRLAVQLACRQFPPPLPAGPGGAPRLYGMVDQQRLHGLAQIPAAFAGDVSAEQAAFMADAQVPLGWTRSTARSASPPGGVNRAGTCSRPRIG
jgi:hypothetical protein